jgi:hypothetical protein
MPILSASAALNININETQALGSFGGGTPFSAAIAKVFQFLSIGTGAGQLNTAYAKDRTVSNGTPDVINLTSGALFQPDGVTPATFTDVLALGFYNGGSAGQNLLIGAGSNAFSARLGTAGIETIYPSMVSFVGGALAQGYPITDLLTIGGGATAGTFPLALTAGGSTQTATITYSAGLTAAAVQAALIALPNVGASNAVVTGSNGGPYTINFSPAVGTWSMTTSAASLTGGTPTCVLSLQNVINVNVSAGSAVPYVVFAIGH